jgi:hypothetical protein
MEDSLVYMGGQSLQKHRIRAFNSALSRAYPMAGKEGITYHRPGSSKMNLDTRNNKLILKHKVP